MTENIQYQTIDSNQLSTKDYPRAYPILENSATYRKTPEHFRVDETLKFEPLGYGDHLYLYVEKKNCNTDWLAKEFARKYNLKNSDVGYAGRKDRFAVTRQWFSIHIPESKEMKIDSHIASDYKILESSRHTHKLRKGDVKENKFKIQLTDFVGDYQEFKKRVDVIEKNGFPNYFGPQRFGHGGNNVQKAAEMLSGARRIKDRNKRSIYLSSARSFIFNQILKIRIKQNSWLKVEETDELWNHNTNSSFEASESGENSRTRIQDKIEKCELSICGSLVGDTQITTCKAEVKVVAEYSELVTGIKNTRIQPQYRSMRCFASGLKCIQNEQGIQIEFSLPKGSYATSLLRELVSQLVPDPSA